MSVLVTGATGFIGSHLAERLLSDGHSIVALARPSSDVSRLEASDARIVHGDVRNRDDVRRAMSGCATVYHLAAARTFHTDDPADFHSVNETGTRNVVEAARELGIERLIHVSTVGVHGSRSGVLDESSEMAPDSPYRRSRHAAEMIVREQQAQGLPVTIARLTVVYGPRGIDWQTLFSEIANGRFNLPGSGTNVFHASYVDDVVEALIRCGTVPGAVGRTYLVGSQSPGTLWAFVSEIAEASGSRVRRRPWLDRPLAMASRVVTPLGELDGFHAVARRIDFFIRSQRCDLTRARRELELPPSVPTPEAVRQTLGWFRRYALL